MYECINCSWKGKEVKQPNEVCPVCGDNVLGCECDTVENKVDLDVNNDGKFDKEDVSIMAKVIGKRGGRPSKTTKKKK